MAAAPAAQNDNGIVGFRSQLEQRADEFRMVLPAHITPEKFQRTVLTAVQSDPELLTADRRSLILACMKAAQDGLLPDKREAALVIFVENKKDKQTGEWTKRKVVQYMPMVYGLRKKILQSGEIASLNVNVVYRREFEEGFFVYEEGSEAMLRHKPMLDLSPEDAKDENIVAAYSMATFKDGSKDFKVLRRFQIDKVRECSQTGATRDRKGQPRTPSGPWVDWYPEQAMKTALRAHSKTLPMSGDILDVEGQEYEAALASRSVQSALATDPEPPVALPSRDDAPVQLEHSREVDEQLDREAFRQFDGQPEHDEDGVIVEQEEKPKAQQRKRSPQPTEPREEERGAAESPTSAEPVAADNGGSLLDQAKAEIDAATTPMDVNSRVSDWRKRLTDEEADELISYGMARVADLKAAANG